MSSNPKNRTPKSEVIKYKKSETPRLGLSSASAETPNRSDLGFSRLGLCKNPQIDGIGYCRVRVWQEPTQIRDLGFPGSQESRLTLGACQQQGFSLTNPITPRLIQYPARRDTGILPVPAFLLGDAMDGGVADHLFPPTALISEMQPATSDPQPCRGIDREREGTGETGNKRERGRMEKTEGMRGREVREGSK